MDVRTLPAKSDGDLIDFLGRHIQELDVHAVMEIEGRSYEVPDHIAWIVCRVIGRTAVAHGHGLHRVPKRKSAVLESSTPVCPSDVWPSAKTRNCGAFFSFNFDVMSCPACALDSGGRLVHQYKLQSAQHGRDHGDRRLRRSPPPLTCGMTPHEDAVCGLSCDHDDDIDAIAATASGSSSFFTPSRHHMVSTMM